MPGVMDLGGLGDDLDALTSPAGGQDTVSVPPPLPRREHRAPKGWEPGVAYQPDGAMRVTTTAVSGQAQTDPAAWRQMVEDLGLTVPDGWQVRLVEAKYDPVAWTRDDADQDKAVTRPVWRYRFAVAPAIGSLALDDLLARVKRVKPAARPAPTGDLAYLVGIGDTQVGKADGDGASGTVDRVVASIDAQVARLKELRRAGRPIGTVYLAWLGDCVEGFNSQGGANAWRTTLTITEQVRVIRRLMLHQVEAFRGVAESIVLASIPGNHDEGVRFGGKGIARYDDSWAVEAAVQVGDALAVNPDAYRHVSVVVPGRDELTLTLDMAGTRVGLAHGHQMRPGKAHEWWAKQAHGRQPIGDATLLLHAHLHHLRVEQGGAKTSVQAPAFEQESTWWRHLTGQVAPPGAVTMTVGGGTWDDLKVV